MWSVVAWWCEKEGRLEDCGEAKREKGVLKHLLIIFMDFEHLT